MPPDSVTIRTGSRLHFGPLSYLPDQGRHFGGLGLMLERPQLQVTLTTPPPRTRFGIPSSRATEMLAMLQSRHPFLALPVQVDVESEIPAHSGLGSGTQMALALMDGLLRLHGRSASPTELAELSGRGDRSAIGLYGYEQGGVLIDSGHAPGSPLGELACRVEFPHRWRVLLLQPGDARGLHGSVELQAFRQLRPMSEQISGRLCRLALTEILPALAGENFEQFTRALFEYGQLVGTFFASTQGGVFASPSIRELLKSLPDVARTGLSQSSWGPTVAMFAADDTHADQLRREVWSLIPGHECPVEITSARNQGRSVRES